MDPNRLDWLKDQEANGQTVNGKLQENHLLSFPQ
jgi:hypothetical protein